jgi:hypothetical protein
MKLYEGQTTGAPIPHDLFYWEIWAIIRATGLNITLQVFSLSDLNLLGPIKRKCISSREGFWCRGLITMP